MNRTAETARPDSIRPGGRLVPCAAYVTDLTGRKHPIRHRQRPAVPHRLVFQVPPECPAGRTRTRRGPHGFRTARTTQILEAQPVMRSHELRGEVVEKLGPRGRRLGWHAIAARSCRMRAATRPPRAVIAPAPRPQWPSREPGSRPPHPSGPPRGPDQVPAPPPSRGTCPLAESPRQPGPRPTMASAIPRADRNRRAPRGLRHTTLTAPGLRGGQELGRAPIAPFGRDPHGSRVPGAFVASALFRLRLHRPPSGPRAHRERLNSHAE